MLSSGLRWIAGITPRPPHGRICCGRLPQRRGHSGQPPSWGVVLDIDGVVRLGPRSIPGSAEAIQKLKNAGVPVVFMTNGGGNTEAAKAAELSKLLGDPSIGASQMILSHTPMRELAPRFQDQRVLLVGAKESAAAAAGYGFDLEGCMAVTSGQLVRGTPGLCTLSRPLHTHLPAVDINEEGRPIKAAFIFFDPEDWGADLQVLTDVLMGGQPVGSGTGTQPAEQAAEVYASNPDFVWQNEYPVPRYGQGAFLDCLRALWEKRSGGGQLRITEFGKPHRVQYEAAERMLADLVARTRPTGTAAGPPGRLYMIGDNPAADIRGASYAGDHWRSILVCTGVYKGGPHSNDPVDRAWRVEPDLGSAVERLLAMKAEEHLGDTR